MSPPVDLATADTFLRENARLVDLRRYERVFGDGTGASVRDAVLAYRNPDGGFAGILEPDLRTTTSQPQSAELALRILDEVGGVDRDVGVGLCDWLQTVTADDGGVPFTHESAAVHPAAPHWRASGPMPSSLNPTAPILCLLHRHGVAHPWMGGATGFCWRALGLEGGQSVEELIHYTVRAALFLLGPGAPASPDTPALRDRLAEGVRDHIALDPALTAPGAPGHHVGPLEVAPFPGDPGRELLPVDAVEAALDALQDRQRPDGGWEVNFEPISPAATAEWRSWATLQALLILRAARRL